MSDETCKTKFDAVLIAGPTASGKSNVALALAERLQGTIINTDSMQVYDGLRLLTARPSREEEARVPHRLYGFIDPAQACSVGIWGEHALTTYQEVVDQGRVPIFVGGTGLYFSALIDGLSPIPEIPEDVSAQARTLWHEIGANAFAERIAEIDPESAQRVLPTDRQRLIRCLEVYNATGKTLSHWQSLPRKPLIDGNFARFILQPDRAWLYQRCETRFDQMVQVGALDEVRVLMDRGLDPELPAMKALGMPELMAHLRGEMSRDEAVERAKQQTRRYAKRQYTWFRNQMITWNRLEEQESERLIGKIFSIICY